MARTPNQTWANKRNGLIGRLKRSDQKIKDLCASATQLRRTAGSNPEAGADIEKQAAALEAQAQKLEAENHAMTAELEQLDLSRPG